MCLIRAWGIIAQIDWLFQRFDTLRISGYHIQS